MTRPWGIHLDSRFFWNEKYIESLLIHSTTTTTTSRNHHHHDLALELLNFRIPVTSAYIGIKRDLTIHTNDNNNNTTTNNHTMLYYDELLISRRSKFRSGTRFTRRGADGTGNVANFVETEQLCIVHDKKLGSLSNNKKSEKNLFL
jgi:hypothetical protein